MNKKSFDKQKGVTVAAADDDDNDDDENDVRLAIDDPRDMFPHRHTRHVHQQKNQSLTNNHETTNE